MNATNSLMPTRRQFITFVAVSAGLPSLLRACGVETPRSPAFLTDVYRNLFAEQGKSAQEIAAKLDAAWQSLFDSTDDDRRVYYPAGSNPHGPMAYVKDIGNSDIRSEGMSYGMMIAVQMNKQAEFNGIWNWAKTYMQHQDADRQGYFSWHASDDGTRLDPNPASDGEEWFATALFFAAGRWGDGTGIYQYRAEADAILNTMLHKTDMLGDSSSVTNMFDHAQHQVVFVPFGNAATFTDPSYHLPAFYELWARWTEGYNGGHEADRQFWLETAKTSREFFQKVSQSKTGLTPDYATFDGTPNNQDGHGDFRFDAFRTISNVAVDYAWFGADEREAALCDRLQAFFASQPHYVNQYTLDGAPLSSDRSPGLIAMNAVASLAATDKARAARFVQELWNLQPPTGKWRYYDGLLYFLALLHVSGNFRVYPPK